MKEKEKAWLWYGVPFENFVPSRASMRHVCESLSFNELEEAFDRQVMDIGLIKIIEICDKLSPSCDNRLLKHRDLLVLGECGTGFAPVPGGVCMGLIAYNSVCSGQRIGRRILREIVLRWLVSWLA